MYVTAGYNMAGNVTAGYNTAGQFMTGYTTAGHDRAEYMTAGHTTAAYISASYITAGYIMAAVYYGRVYDHRDIMAEMQGPRYHSRYTTASVLWPIDNGR